MKQKSYWLVLILVVMLIAACSSKSSTDRQLVKIAAASVPHAELLEWIAEDLQEEGIELEILIVSDGIQTNIQTAEGELDANFFQHSPYLSQVNEDSDLDLVSVEKVHVEPFGLYSRSIQSIEELPDQAKVSIPEDPVNFSRALELLAANQIIELDGSKTTGFTLEDIKKNDKHIEFVPVQAEMLVHSLDDVDASTINANFALEAGFNPLEDALLLEDESSNYVNILVARRDNQDEEAIQTLARLLTSDKVKSFIEEKYKGAVIPVF